MATNVASRGLDIPGVALVVVFPSPATGVHVLAPLKAGESLHVDTVVQNETVLVPK